MDGVVELLWLLHSFYSFLRNKYFGLSDIELSPPPEILLSIAKRDQPLFSKWFNAPMTVSKIISLLSESYTLLSQFFVNSEAWPKSIETFEQGASRQ